MQNGKKFKKSGYLRLDYLDLEKRHSMLDYIKGGCEIGLTVAIDYTASNGAPSSATSLHYHNSMSYNQYQKAIISIGEILREYDRCVGIEYLKYVYIVVMCVLIFIFKFNTFIVLVINNFQFLDSGVKLVEKRITVFH
mgnify:CR=1 FL=1